MKKRILIGLMAGCMAFGAVPGLPAIMAMPVQVEAAEADDTVSPCADQIVWRYRTLDDGTIQKRRWNATKGYWVDPKWIFVMKI